MSRTTASIASLAGAVAAIAGVGALGRTLSLSTAAHRTSDTQVAARTAQLDRYQASLERMLAQRPPALPPLPSSDAAARATQAAPQRVVYHRPPPIVVTVHRTAGEHEDEHEAEAEGAEWDD
jgi:hypothetical protein